MKYTDLEHDQEGFVNIDNDEFGIGFAGLCFVIAAILIAIGLGAWLIFG